MREIKSAGGEAIACTESVATPTGGAAIIAAAFERYGRLDILIHNAGIVRSRSLQQMSYEDFDAVLDVHLRGAFHVVRPAFPHMCAAGYGRIVLTSSIGGLYGNHGVANYAAAKAGVIGLSNVVALEGGAHNVKCNVIVPAAETRMAQGRDTSGYPRGARSWWRPLSVGSPTKPVRSAVRCWSRSLAGLRGSPSPKLLACAAIHGRSRRSASKSTRSGMHRRR
ncbi:peroxisomal multifunctional enzyme type 2 [Mycobacterium xenopi 4042]|uniref:Peroxisomal multifunctional enzyme type 2 n=1 Tax=Mycobacterium xenopi 4042 TaxID=1299334 RepID=X8CKU9_MYCXE|nr:peroxisomal multifunctional enzyme type 2 [Mycobacterium xenopi 4042]